MAGLSEVKSAAPRWLKNLANTATRAYGLRTASRRAKPDFAIIGTKRGGTTSLFNYLLMHPGVYGLFPQVRGRKSTDYFFIESARGEEWYRSHFPTIGRLERTRRKLGYAPVSGEASPYYIWDPRIADKVAAVTPGLKAIVLLRNPVERAWSHYKERIENGVEPLSFGAALEAEPARLEGELERMSADPYYYSEPHDWFAYRGRGIYLPQIRNWMEAFPAQQLLILRSEDLYSDVQKVFDEVCTFLEIDKFQLLNKRPFNASGGQSTVPPEARAELTEFFKPHNLALEVFLGRPLDWS